MRAKTKFWVEDPCILLSDLVFFPTADMSREEKLNALTRLALVIGLVMYAMEYEHWHVFTLTAILAIVVIEYSSRQRNCVEESGTSTEEIKEEFTLVPTYIDDDFATTVVAPLFSEEHRVPPPAYDHRPSMSLVESQQFSYEVPDRPQAYPYGQYLTRSNLLPSDEYTVTANPTGGARTAREYVNSAFRKHDMAHRENMTRLIKKRLNRRFRHNTNDTWSPFHSY